MHSQQPQQPGPYAPHTPPPAPRSWFARHKILTGIGALFVFLVAVSVAGGDVDSSTDTSATAPKEQAAPAKETEELTEECRRWIEKELLDSSDDVDAESGYVECGDLSDEEMDRAIDGVTDDLMETGATPAEEAPEEEAPDHTVSQQSAIEAAQGYLDLSGFSKAGLIDQLTSEYGNGFSKADAEYAVENVTVDWNEEAVQSAETYMEMGGFSRNSLIDQLTSPHGGQFTQAQAAHAADNVGL
ncbi:MAG TPA: hypothetical protein DEQ61_13170 [Streptomyces sp.]|nr:hypothetical protein [Streptomyces sp.]